MAAPLSGFSDFSGSALGVSCDMNVTDALSLVSAGTASAAAYAILYTLSPSILPLPTTWYVVHNMYCSMRYCNVLRMASVCAVYKKSLLRTGQYSTRQCAHMILLACCFLPSSCRRPGQSSGGPGAFASIRPIHFPCCSCATPQGPGI